MPTIDTGTQIGPDGDRYDMGSVPASEPADVNAAGLIVHGVPAAGQAPIWDGVSARAEWATAIDEAAVQALIDDAIASLIAGAPGALDTLNELAAALGDDASFAAAVTSSLAGKQDLHADLTDLVARWTAASASGPAQLDFAEDTDNGAHKISLKAPAALAADRSLTLPDMGADAVLPRGEIGYQERTTADSTSNSVIGSAPSNKISGLAITVVGTGRPVEIEFYTPAVWHSTANNYVGVALLIDGVQAQLGQGSSPSTATGRSLITKSRKVLTAGVEYTFEVGKYCQTGATGNYHGAADAPMYLSVTER